jgi:hemerythrin-like metal-binding protein
MFELEDLPEVALEGLNTLHAEEVEMINRLAELAEEVLASPESEVEIQELDALLGTFAEHVEGHFEIEVSNMQRTKYDGLEDHQAEHDGVRERLDALVAGWIASRDAAPLLTFFESFLPEWFIDHVATFDVPTAEFVAAAD